jgi:gliding motility-associated-like protein
LTRSERFFAEINMRFPNMPVQILFLHCISIRNMMTRQLFLLAAALFFMVQTAYTQTPRTIISQPSASGPEAACPVGQQNYAGTVSIGPANAQSNDIDLDTMFLCLGDEVQILHNGDQDLSGDPDPTTPPGIGYAFYDCPPTISGPDKASIGTDPCLVNDPPPLDLFYVATEGNLNGDILFFNDGNLIGIFNGGLPALFWWTPITFDALSIVTLPPPLPPLVQAVYEDNGPCVHANVNAALAVVYLTEIAISNISVGGGNTGCGGSFSLNGGLPQWNGSNYSIDISLVSNPSIKGVVTNGPATHGGQVNFLAPQAGLYQITVEDGKSCGASAQVNIGTCQAVILSIESGSGLPGETVCIDVTVDNFTGISGVQYTMVYDLATLSLVNIQNYNPGLSGLGIGNFNPLPGEIIFSWNDFNPVGSSLPDGSVLYTLCFQVVGALGDCSPVAYSNDPVVIEVITPLGLTDVITNDGEICATDNTLNVVVTATPAACPGVSNGSFTATVSGGTTPYQISWQNLGGGPVQGPGVINTQGGSFTASNLATGNYGVTVTDGGSAPDFTGTIFIDEGPALNVIFTQTAPLCNGGTGSITAVIVLDSVIVTNPGPQYTFLWSNMAMTQTISGVLSGLYSVTVTDMSTGCFTSGPTFLPQTPAITITTNSIVNATCSGVADGEISVTASGGTPGGTTPYTFFWPGVAGGTTQTGTSVTLSGLLEGTYNLIVTDGNGCTQTAQLVVGASKSLTITPLSTLDISCFGICDGSISVQASTIGGLSNSYSFAWTGVPGIPPPGPVNTPNTSAVNNLCAGSYNVTLMDDAGCEVTASFVLTQPPVLDATVLSFTNESCLVGNDGTATLGVTGGVYPYTYAWGIPGQTDSTATSLSAGAYEVTVTDANGCEDLVNFTITQPTPPQIVSFDDALLDCFDDTNGVLTVVATPGSAAISNYAWSTGASGATQTSISGLSPGSYCVTVTSTDACATIACADVAAPAPLQLDDVATSPTLCPGLGGGAASVFISGGTGPYFYDWSLDIFDGVGVSAIGGAPVIAGTYIVIVTDANNCPSLTVNVTVENPPAIQAIFSAIDSVSCFANQGVPCDGTATATAQYSDGTTGLFNFQWPSGELTFNAASSTASQLCQGNQVLTVSDGTCTATFPVFIPFPDTLNLASVSIKDVTCFGYSDGSVTLQAKGGTQPYTYSWSNAQSGNMASNLGPGVYSVTIMDSKGCLFQATMPVAQPAELIAFVDTQNSIDSVTCAGDSDAVISVTAQGGNINISPTLTYVWQGGIAPPFSSTASGLSAGTYNVTVSDILGCFDVVTFTVFEPAPIEFILGPIAEIPCAGQTTVITVDTAWGGNGFAPFWYSFSVGNASTQSLGTPIEVFAGTQLVTVFDFEGCSVDTLLIISEPPPIVLIYPDIVEVELGDSVRLQPLIVNPPFVIFDSIVWTPPTYLRFETDSLLPWVRPFETTQYQIQAFDINGCLALASVLVEVDKNRNIFFPNIFTPNFDGINDYFFIYTGNGTRQIRSMRVFDRWGELLFERLNIAASPYPDPLNGWDGTFRGKVMPAGVYVYIAEVEFEDGQVLLYRGDVTLLR